MKQTGTENPNAIARFLLHLHPPKIDKRAVQFNKTFGLGGINVLLFVVLALSGLLLRFTYVPTPEKAYNSILFLQNKVLFGQLLRNIHHIAAQLIVVVSFLHPVRVYYTQSIYGKRAKNWIYGLIIFIVVLFFNFTGYLLPWDQLSYWAVTIMTGMVEYIPFIGLPLANLFRGGATVDGATLINFYNLHTGILPLLMVFLLAMHFWLVRKAKGIALSENQEIEMVDTNPALVSKEVFAGLMVLAILFLTAVFYDAPLLDKANTTLSPNPSKAPWYFMGAQELLLHMHPVLAVFIIPVTVLVFFGWLPYFKVTQINPGTWFNSNRGLRLVIISAIYSVVFTAALILLFDLVFRTMPFFTSLPQWISGGIIPVLMYALPTGLLLWYFYTKKGAAKVELLMSLVSIIWVSYVIMIIVGVWLRGQGMNLIFA